jgi:hypothetical protein
MTYSDGKSRHPRLSRSHACPMREFSPLRRHGSAGGLSGHLHKRAGKAHRAAWNLPIGSRRASPKSSRCHQAHCDVGGIAAKRGAKPFVAPLVASEGGPHGSVGGVAWQPGIAAIHRHACIEGRGESSEHALHPGMRGEVQECAADDGVDRGQRQTIRHLREIGSQGLDAPLAERGIQDQGRCFGWIREARSETAAPCPFGGALNRRREQRSIGIGEDPALGAPDDGRHETEQATGAGAQVQQTRLARQTLRQGSGKRGVARRLIEPLAQPKPIGRKLQRRPSVYFWVQVLKS